MAKARILAQAMPKGAERCAVEGIIAERDNRLEEATKLLPRCLAIFEQFHSPRARAAFRALLDCYARQGAYRKEHALIVRWLAAHGEPADPDELADLHQALGTAAALRDVSRPEATGSSSATLRSYRNVRGTQNVDLTVRGVTLWWYIDTGANLSVVTESAPHGCDWQFAIPVHERLA